MFHGGSDVFAPCHYRGYLKLKQALPERDGEHEGQPVRLFLAGVVDTQAEAGEGEWGIQAGLYRIDR